MNIRYLVIPAALVFFAAIGANSESAGLFLICLVIAAVWIIRAIVSPRPTGETKKIVVHK